ncbi:MAG: hypothetical protein HY286_07140 [Planctomycetes bacterium]|nr:hypothetical protein [Planctomycetota bacterium]
MGRLVAKLLLAACAGAAAVAIAEWIARASVVSKSGATDFESYRRRCLGEPIAIFDTDEKGELVDIKPGSFQGDLIHINSQGFRGEPVLDPKPADGFRICMIGGSGCFGTTSSGDATTIEGFLQKELRANARAPERVEVMNGAIPGATTARAIDRYERRLAKYAPDFVILYNLVNDMLESRRARLGLDPRMRPLVNPDSAVEKLLSHSAIWLVFATAGNRRDKERELDEAARLDVRTAAGRAARRGRVEEIKSAIARESDYHYDGAAATNLYLVPEHLQYFKQQLARYRDAAAASGARPIYCTFAFRFNGNESEDQYHKDGPATAMYLPNWAMARDAMKAMNQYIRDAAKTCHAPLVDVDAELVRNRNYFPDGDTDHFTDEGCKAVAGIIAKNLATQGLLLRAAAPK